MTIAHVGYSGLLAPQKRLNYLVFQFFDNEFYLMKVCLFV